jgi:DNA-binding CsgD family transcriptional regulator
VQRFGAAEATVDHHVSSLLRTFDAATRAEAVAGARRLGLLENGHAATPT